MLKCKRCGKELIRETYNLCDDCSEEHSNYCNLPNKDKNDIFFNKYNEEKNYCLACDDEIAYYYNYCATCYYLKPDITDEIKHENKNKEELIIDYNKLKNILKNKTRENAITYKELVTLYVIATELSEKFNNHSLINNINKDRKEFYYNKGEKQEDDEDDDDKIKQEDIIPKEINSNNNFSYEDYRKKYPAEYRCKNGIYVRSLSEKIIADWLYDNNIRFEYEAMLLFFKNDKQYYCDFYLKDLNTYIEFWGRNEKSYIKHKKEKEELYEQNKTRYKLISINPEHMKNIDDALKLIIHLNK
jgi:hypothetical protein